jgi:hypothetical protein
LQALRVVEAEQKKVTHPAVKSNKQLEDGTDFLARVVSQTGQALGATLSFLEACLTPAVLLSFCFNPRKILNIETLTSPKGNEPIPTYASMLCISFA